MTTLAEFVNAEARRMAIHSEVPPHVYDGDEGVRAIWIERIEYALSRFVAPGQLHDTLMRLGHNDPTNWQPIRMSDYRKSDEWWKGRRVKSTCNLRTNGGTELPAGTLWTVTRKWGGLHVTSDPCPCCGLKMSITKCNQGYFMIGDDT